MSTNYNSFIEEQLSVVGPVVVRRMFGGAGVFLDDLMFALVADETLYFKSDDQSKQTFENEGLEPFIYQAKGGKRAVMSYWRAPERVFDDPDEMRVWAENALRAAQSAAAKKAKGQPPPSQKRRKTTGKRK
ncbi:MAG: TfoX/Sxy family protein [Hyphomicrobiaceae bacterium]